MGKKYLFPFEKEKKIYPWKEVIALIVASYVFILILCLSIIKTSEEENKLSITTFFQSSPDLIVVPTGDLGRIPKAIELATKYGLSDIFITGVYKKNSIDTILPQSNFDQIDLNQFDIDYWARNTIENAISTLKYLSDKGDINRILIVSSDYHIQRIRMIFQNLQIENEKQYQFYYFGVNNTYSKLDNIIKLHKEAVKLIRGWLIMKLWTPEVG
jgi:uncharacterized SAM-binding protein YcdF (DUF218 family)